MDEWTRDREYAAVTQAAIRALEKAMADGKADGKHAPGSYREESIEHQMRHIEAHITAYQCGDRSEDHLGHIVCRSVMAYALDEMQSKNQP